MIDFDGQVAVVTGAGGTLGRLYALELARRGAAVVVNDLGTTPDGKGSDASAAERVALEIERAGGVAVASHDSVETPDGGEAIIGMAVERFGRVDTVVSNAGIVQNVAFDALTAEDWQRMIGVHLSGGFHISQPAYRVMKEQGYGRFVFITSSAGLFGQPLVAHYAAAKSGLLGLAHVIGLEGAPFGIAVNCVLPFGYSRMVTFTVGDREQSPEEAAFLRAIDPELVVPLVVFLASRSCDLTHHAFSAAAGRYARVFIGLNQGWSAPEKATPATEDIAEHLDQLTSTDEFTIPMSIFEEMAAIRAQRGLGAVSRDALDEWNQRVSGATARSAGHEN